MDHELLCAGLLHDVLEVTDTLPRGQARWWFALRLVVAMPRMAMILRWRDVRTWPPPRRTSRAKRAPLRLLGWILASDLRTWAVLVPPLAWLVLDTAAERLADAVVIAITVPPVPGAGVHAIRVRLRGGGGRG